MSDEIALAGAARLFGRLAVGPIDHELADELWAPEQREALARLGIELPERTRDGLARLAAEYVEAFAEPPHLPPLLQSSCEAGDSESVASAVREFADAMGVEIDEEAARSAPGDHLGVELALWAELVEEASIAREFAARHLVWALPHLERRSEGGGLYARLADVIAQFIVVISSR